MERNALSLPSQKNYEFSYGLAYQLAVERLQKLDDIEEQCRRSDARLQVIGPRKVISLEYLNRTYQITLPGVEVSLSDNDEDIPLRDKILILHYLLQAKGTPISGKAIAYKELPEAKAYFPTFYKRAIQPLVSHYGKQTHLLLDAAKALGGQKADYGDVSVTVRAFSCVPITIVLWQGDEEFPPEGNIMFDSTISDYLPTEDIIVLCQTIAWTLVKMLETGGDNPGRSCP